MERERVTGLCKEALGRDPEEGFEELERAVVAGLAIVEYPGTEDQLKVFADTKDLFELTVKRRNCRAELTRATDFADKFVFFFFFFFFFLFFCLFVYLFICLFLFICFYFGFLIKFSILQGEFGGCHCPC